MPTALEIVTPERLLLSRAVDMVVIPAAEGELGVLPGHAPMIVLLRGGILRVFEGAQESSRMFVAGGFAEITPERCTVLADEIMPLAEVSKSAAERRVNEAEAAYAAVDKSDIAARDATLDRLQSARAMLAVAEAP
jgi:F-type H+-transporting ATPase subunit epsilon